MTAKGRRGSGPAARRIVSRERGAGLAEAIMAVMVLMVMSVPFLSKVAVNLETAGTAANPEAALGLAEAGVEKAVWELNEGAWSGTEDISADLSMSIDGLETPGGSFRGDVMITLSPLERAGGTRRVTVTGTVRLADGSRLSRSVEAVLRKGADYAIVSWGEPAAGQ